MGMTSTTETRGTAGPQSEAGRQALQLLGQAGESAAAQMGDLSDIAAGNFQLTPLLLEITVLAVFHFKDCAEKVCIENPIPHKRAKEAIGDYTQIIQPYQFGHDYSKKTCLWLAQPGPAFRQDRAVRLLYSLCSLSPGAKSV